MIDHLPRNSWYSQAVANDPEHAKMLAEAMAMQPKSDAPQEEWAPPMATYSAEVEALHGVTNELKRLSGLFIQANSKEGSPAPKLTLIRVPQTALQVAVRRAERARKKAKHEALVARVLPHKRRAVE